MAATTFIDSLQAYLQSVGTGIGMSCHLDERLPHVLVCTNFPALFSVCGPSMSATYMPLMYVLRKYRQNASIPLNSVSNVSVMQNSSLVNSAQGDQRQHFEEPSENQNQSTPFLPLADVFPGGGRYDWPFQGYHKRSGRHGCNKCFPTYSTYLDLIRDIMNSCRQVVPCCHVALMCICTCKAVFDCQAEAEGDGGM